MRGVSRIVHDAAGMHRRSIKVRAGYRRFTVHTDIADRVRTPHYAD
jgi:hypothetical protein